MGDVPTRVELAAELRKMADKAKEDAESRPRLERQMSNLAQELRMQAQEADDARKGLQKQMTDLLTAMTAQPLPRPMQHAGSTDAVTIRSPLPGPGLGNGPSDSCTPTQSSTPHLRASAKATPTLRI
eukprot:2856683-Prymnesium_polylepis.1